MTKGTKPCRACGAAVPELLDCGPQPVCNRFPAAAGESEYTHPLIVGQCPACGLVQLTVMPPASELRPRQSWITYSEPEGHLDALADRLAALPGLGSYPIICGVSFKDDSLLRRLGERCQSREWRVEPVELGVTQAGVGVETVQDKLMPRAGADLAGRHGQADLVIARHILEHAHDLPGFLAAVGELAKPGAIVVFEVPDCGRALKLNDYTTLWEEHSVYFTPETLRLCLQRHGFTPLSLDRIPYALEDSLVAVTRRSAPVTGNAAPAAELERGRAFAAGLAARRRDCADFLSKHRQAGGRVALFGAGHLACAFVNLLGLKEHITCVIDDHPNKRGLRLPGSGLPIVGSEALVRERITLCLLSLNPDYEDKVIAKNQAFVEAGGAFHSIFPGSRRAFLPGDGLTGKML
jgi:SAM-dependent methyltransferase